MTQQLSLLAIDAVAGPPGDLVVQRVNHETARIPCEQWHYAAKLPSMMTDIFGVWEQGIFQGVIIFGFPVSKHAGAMFGYADNQPIRELLRIALKSHATAISAMLSKAISSLRSDSFDVQMLISYADPAVGHHGGVYQAASWVYLGTYPPRPRVRAWEIHGEVLHARTAGHRYGRANHQWLKDNVDPCLTGIVWEPKHKYAFGLNRRMRTLLQGMAKPYPKDGI